MDIRIQHFGLRVERDKMKILVTGGAGFIGSNFIRYILEKYTEISIINYDSLTYAGNLKKSRGYT